MEVCVLLAQHHIRTTWQKRHALSNACQQSVPLRAGPYFRLVCLPFFFTCVLLLLDDGAVVMEVDHEKQVVYTEPLVLSPRDAPSLLAAMQPSQENTAQRLTSPIVSTHLNTRNIAFER